MKNSLKILAIILCSIVCVTAAMSEEITDGARFEKEYEILNGQYDLEGINVYSHIDVPSDSNIKYLDLTQTLDLLEEGTGIIYFGFPECPWCRTLIPVLFEAIGEAEYTGTIYYCNALYDRNYLSLNEAGEIIVEQEGTAEYAMLLEKLGYYLGPYEGLGDESIKRLYFPTTVFLNKGAVKYVHLVTVQSQESGRDELTPEQHAELLEALKSGIEAID